MYYYLLKSNEADTGLPIKTNSKIQKICSKMSRIINLHAKLDRELVKELATLNNITEEEASDIMSSYDFLVDESQYGLSNFSNEIITREKYLKIKKGNNNG